MTKVDNFKLKNINNLKKEQIISKIDKMSSADLDRVSVIINNIENMPEALKDKIIELIAIM